MLLLPSRLREGEGQGEGLLFRRRADTPSPNPSRKREGDFRHAAPGSIPPDQTLREGGESHLQETL